MDADWFRNTTWDDAIEQVFDGKLRRARDKGQYLRIQASILSHTNPEVALKLLGRYFELPLAFDHAQAHVDRANALLALDRLDEALGAYEAALAREAVFPNLRTQAALELPFIIASHGIEEQYVRALELLSHSKQSLQFPVDHFRWHAASALIAAARGESGVAQGHAARAREAAKRDNSGLRYHPFIGLVGSRYESVIERLVALESKQ
jgi:hypothetical protein